MIHDGQRVRNELGDEAGLLVHDGETRWLVDKIRFSMKKVRGRSQKRDHLQMCLELRDTSDLYKHRLQQWRGIQTYWA